MIPTTSKPGRRATDRASSATSAGECSGERRAPTRTRPPNSLSEVSNSRQTRTTSRPPSRAWSMSVSCAGSSTITVTAAASFGSPVSSAKPARSADG
ncbi:hypothetical protein SGLAM104S_01822 [Streptomyces glaucescens]